MDKVQAYDTMTIVPYKNQMALYQGKEKIAMTIDSAQTREWDVVILDTVRCNPGGSLGFLKEVNRLTVAFSQHKTKLHVLLCSQMMKNDELKIMMETGAIEIES